MARTKSSRGAAPFKLKSGNSPMTFLPILGGAIGGFLNRNKNKGDSGGGMEEKVDQIHEKLMGDGEGTMAQQATAGAQNMADATGGGEEDGPLGKLAKKIAEGVNKRKTGEVGGGIGE